MVLNCCIKKEEKKSNKTLNLTPISAYVYIPCRADLSSPFHSSELLLFKRIIIIMADSIYFCAHYYIDQRILNLS